MGARWAGAWGGAWAGAWVCLVLCAAGARGQAGAGGLGGGGPVTPHADQCVPGALAGAVRAEVDAYMRAHPAVTDRAGSTFDHFPQAGNWQRDLSEGLFVDLDPTGGVESWNCGTLTYDSHAGCDSGLRTFAEVDIGVPVFAALPGTVVGFSDGYPDHNLQPDGNPGNYIILDHGGGLQTWYFHLRSGSPTPGLGGAVVAGQQIGLAASSGYSYGPHLHFQVMLNGQVYEPYAGACRPGPSMYTDQMPYTFGTSIVDAAFSFVDLATVPGNPQDVPRTGQLALSDTYHWVWTQVQNLPANSTFRFRYIRPNGTVSYESPVWPFNNPEFYGRAWYWFSWWIDEMHSITGTWRVQIEFNGVQQAEMPVEVRAARTSDFNRPPVALHGLSFDPPVPVAGRALYCRVDTPLVVDDPDYDVVRYRYQWIVGDTLVRDVVTAGQADALRADLVDGGLVGCVVTPMDASLSGPASFTSFGSVCDSVDFNNDGLFPDTADIDDFLAVFSGGACSTGPSMCNDIDYNNDGLFPDTLDIDALLSVFSGGACLV
ncbi:MAG: M23 family metallopeptidase [Phycisphaerales bacterium]